MLGTSAAWMVTGCSAAGDGDTAGITQVVTETVTVSAAPTTSAATFEPCQALEDLYAKHQEQEGGSGSTALGEAYVLALTENGCQAPAAPTSDDAAASTQDQVTTPEVCDSLEDAYQQELEAGRVAEGADQYWQTMFEANGCQDRLSP